MAESEADCIFCKILAGEMPGEVVQEDEHTVAFMDINPWTRGHAVVTRGGHSKNLYEIEGRGPGAHDRRRQTARDRYEGPARVRRGEPAELVRAAAWQTIFHLHVHVIPRYEGDPLELPTRPQRAEPGGTRRDRCRDFVAQRASASPRDGDVGVLTLDVAADEPVQPRAGREPSRRQLGAIEAARPSRARPARRGPGVHGRRRR